MQVISGWNIGPDFSEYFQYNVGHNSFLKITVYFNASQV